MRAMPAFASTLIEGGETRERAPRPNGGKGRPDPVAVRNGLGLIPLRQAVPMMLNAIVA